MASRGRQSVKDTRTSSTSAAAAGSDYGYRQRVDAKYAVKAEYRKSIQSLIPLHLTYAALSVGAIIIHINQPQYSIIPSYCPLSVAIILTLCITLFNTLIIRYQLTAIIPLIILLITSLVSIFYIGVYSYLHESTKNTATASVSIVGGLIDLLL